jgi:hypothetical protein
MYRFSITVFISFFLRYWRWPFGQDCPKCTCFRPLIARLRGQPSSGQSPRADLDRRSPSGSDAHEVAAIAEPLSFYRAGCFHCQRACRTNSALRKVFFRHRAADKLEFQDRPKVSQESRLSELRVRFPAMKSGTAAIHIGVRGLLVRICEPCVPPSVAHRH